MTTTCHLNLYDTDKTTQSNSLQFDCLNYYVYREKQAYQELSDVVDGVIPYCFRPTNNFDQSLEAFVNPLSQNLSFEEIRLSNITSQQLLSWSIPIEVAERYQFYLNEQNSLLNEYFYNCTEPWFGLECQYSFVFGGQMFFNQIVEAALHSRIAYSELSNMIVQIPCYVLLECHRDGQIWCLDWREVCDGAIDCFDEGLDEKFCFDMEINECEENEYRCHNGQCIPQEFWEEGTGDADCLDRSDEVPDALYITSCYQDPTFRCEEHSCRPNTNTFPCGDGECVAKFDKCHNSRHVLLIDSMTAKSNLTDECWIAMVCLTRLVNENLCRIWLTNNSAYKFLEQCDSFFQFPTIPVYSDHVRFFYKNLHLGPNVSGFLLPDYVCFDQRLCDFITPLLVYQNVICLQNSKSILYWHVTGDPWIQMMLSIEQYFRPCSILFHNHTKYRDHPSLYHCENSSMFISKHRIMDAKEDCFWEDDENYKNSCQLNHRYRVRCGNPDKCWSPLLKIDACLLNEEQDTEEIPFQSFCNGIPEHFFRDNNEEEQDEEFGCEDWLCDNIYARCDGHLACSDGRDETNCRQTNCSSMTHACMSPLNYSVICLPFKRVNDKTIDCLGASDEQDFCRNSYPSNEISHRFHCLNDTTCLRSSQLCNDDRECALGDDEEFCTNHRFTCDRAVASNRNEVEEILCGLSEDENARIEYFSIHTSSNYPLLESSVVDTIIHGPTERRPITNVNASRGESDLWPWYCNRGLVVHTWVRNSSDNRTCICPPSYYGNFCQYQNQRISLTLQLSSDDKHATYAIVIMLIDDNDDRQEISAYDQFVYIAKRSCSIKLNRYLLFSTRPKNLSKNYSVRIDAFETKEIKYVGSWLFPLTFLFLPVNRLGASLILSNYLNEISHNCSISCNNGECVKYLNKEDYFCRCSSGWSGIHCHIPMNCQTCSVGSVCIGSANNRSICVCPSGKFGPRCIFTATCPAIACQNNGECVPADVSIPGSEYTCICPDRYFGPNCQYQKAKLEVSLNDINIPPYVVAYFFTLSNESEPITTIILRKLTLFQHIVTFHISVLFHMVIIQSSDKYYLALLQQTPKIDISTLVSPAQECISTQQLFNSTVLRMFKYQRIVFYYDLCRTRPDLTCFIDEDYLCLCTNDRHANCILFNYDRKFQCSPTNHCTNKAQCLQDHPTCPSTRICICPNCFFGDQCQFYAKGLGSTLDEILGYEFKRNTVLSKQPFTVKMSVAITTLIFIIGIINGILSILTFSRKKSREVGSGIYLLASSITSLLTMMLFTIKFWFLFLSHQNLFNARGQQFILDANCLCIEPLLKMFLYMDNWLNACVALERTVSVFQGITFNKNKSKLIAKCVSILLTVIISCLFIPQLLNLHVYDDKTEERQWCVVTYSPRLQMFSSTVIFVHYFGPLFINIFSALFIIISSTRRRAATQTNRTVWVHLISNLRHFKHLLISQIIIIILTLPHLIISIILDCNKSSHLFWFYLIGYFLSFIPAAFIFIIFVLPSPLYKQEFKQLIGYIRRRLDILRLNASRL